MTAVSLLCQKVLFLQGVGRRGALLKRNMDGEGLKVQICADGEERNRGRRSHGESKLCSLIWDAPRADRRHLLITV